MTVGRQVSIGAAALAVAFSAAAHSGWIGADVGRAWRQAFRTIGLYSDTSVTLENARAAYRTLRTGSDLERTVAVAGCQAIDAARGRGSLGDADDWEGTIRSHLPEWVADEPSHQRDATIEKAADALAIGEINVRAAGLYVRYCAP